MTRIAMWSGPRNISTAMMRAFGSRSDTAVLDEPLYAHYLAHTGLAHPMAEAVIAAGPATADGAIARCLAPLPPGRVSYQKHMTHHWLPHLDPSFLDALTCCFLIRHPRAVVASYARTRSEPTLADLGFLQQAELFERTCAALGHAPPVIAAEDVLADPSRALAALCQAIGIPFEAAMLSWAPGPRADDGVWAPAWYDSVYASTGFASPRPLPPPLSAPLERLAEAGMRSYARLRAHAL